MRFPGFILLLAAAWPAAAAERRYSVTDFDRVEVHGPYRVTLTTGPAGSSARATGSPAALDRLTVDVQGKTLRVRMNQSSWGGYPNAGTGPATVALTTRDLQAASVNGSGALTVDKARGLKLSVSLTGSGQVSINAVESDNLLVNMLGAGTIVLGGKTKTIRAEVHGTASLDAARLTADDARIVADTAGRISLAATRAANVNATGTGDVEIVGTPACTVKNSGAGNVRCGKN